MILSLFNDKPVSEPLYIPFETEHILARLRNLDGRARRDGLESLEPDSDELISIGMETNAKGRITQNGYGVLNLGWKAAEHPAWLEWIRAEADEIGVALKQTHNARLRFVIWVVSGAAGQTNLMYEALGLLKRTPRSYLLDSTHPPKLKHVLDDICRRSGLRLADALPSTLVIGAVADRTAYEPLVNLDELVAVFEKHRVDSRPNILCLAPASSQLGEWAQRHGYRRREPEPDERDSAASRQCGPLTRGSLYSLAFSKADLGAWMEGACLGDDLVATAWRLSAFLHAQALAGRDKVTLVTPKKWSGVGGWTKQGFELCLGKSKEAGTRIILEDKIRLANYRRPKEARQDRVFLALKVRDLPPEKPDKVSLLRRAGYPVASLTINKGAPLSTYMEFIHCTIFGLAYLRGVNLVTRPQVERHRAMAGKLFREAKRVGGIEKCEEWRKSATSPRRIRHRGSITLQYDRLQLDFDARGLDGPGVFASILNRLLASGRLEYAELVFFGDTRYCAPGRAVCRALKRSAETLFRARLKMPVNVLEGPSESVGSFEATRGPGRCLTAVIHSEKTGRGASTSRGWQYHGAQLLASQMLLSQGSGDMVTITLKDLEEPTLISLEDLFRQTGTALRTTKV